MRILLTNDDGIYAPGIYALYLSLKKTADVTVVAPQSEQSAVGHAITMAFPLRVREAYRKQEFFGYAVSGTPADCVKIAVTSLMKQKPDIIVSGINLGPNIGFSVLYSGTISGATEGAILGFPSIAVSLGTFTKPNFSAASDFTAKFVKKVLKHRIPRGTFFSLNVPSLPKKRIKGVKVTVQGKAPMLESFDRREDPRGNTYYWLSGEAMKLKGQKETDILALNQNYISITPLQYDLTDYKFLENVKKWDFNK